MSQEANLSPVQPTWESSRTEPTLRRDSEIIQTLGKTSHKRKVGHNSIIMSRMERFHHWSGFILGNWSKMWSRNYQLSLGEMKLPWSRKRRERLIPLPRKAIDAARVLSGELAVSFLPVDIAGKVVCVCVCLKSGEQTVYPLAVFYGEKEVHCCPLTAHKFCSSSVGQ